MKRIVCIISLIITGSLYLFAQVSVESRIDSIQILIGEQTGLTLSVIAKEGSRIKLPLFEPLQSITPGVEVLESSKPDTLRLDNNLMKIIKRYTLTSFDENLYYLPPMQVFVNGKVYKSKSLALKVVTVPVDTLHPENFFPPKDVQDNPFLWNEWSFAFWLSFSVVLISITIYYLWTRLKENKPVWSKVRIIKKVPPHQKALKEIGKLKENKKSASEDQKSYYTVLTNILREYIKERFGFNAMEMTSSEIISRLRSEGGENITEELGELFITADLVKFAKYSTLLNENDINLINAIEFINTTKQEKQPVVERIEPKLTDTDRQSMRSRTVLKCSMIVLAITGIILFVFAIYQIYLLI